MHDVGEDDRGLRDRLRTLSPTARDKLCDVLILDQSDRDAIATEPLRYGDANGDAWADIVDSLTMYPDARRTVVRILAEIDAWNNRPPVR
jgi:hypothetical protein